MIRRVAIAGVVLCAGLSGACKVTIGDRDANRSEPYKSEAVKRAEESGHVEFDLRRVPSRADVGLNDGEDVAMYDWHDQRKLATVVWLPGDVRFTFDAAHIDAQAVDATGPVKEVRMQGSLPDLESARDELLRAAGTFDNPGGSEMRGFTAEAVDSWYEHERQADPNGLGVTGADYYDGRPHGHVQVEIEVRRRDENRATVFYYFRWGPT